MSAPKFKSESVYQVFRVKIISPEKADETAAVFEKRDEAMTYRNQLEAFLPDTEGVIAETLSVHQGVEVEVE